MPSDANPDTATAAAIFAAAAETSTWTRTNLGYQTAVNHGIYTWTVQIPAGEQPQQAAITYRTGYGGTEHLSIPATWAQTIDLVDQARSTTRRP